MSSELLDVDTPVIPLKESHRFIKECMEAVGTPSSHAEVLADILVEADYRGHYSHGMNRLEMYISEVELKVCDTEASPEILKESPATAWVDGRGGMGPVVGNFCMKIAVEKAKSVGVGIVVAKGSNHYGIAGMYTSQAMKGGLIGMSFTNTSPVVVPTRAKKGAIGTNPISLGAPALNGDSFLLDMATSAVAAGKVEMLFRKNLPIPDTWCQGQFLLPLGGKEENSGYKGYGLGMMVELLCGILGGAAYGPNIRVVGDQKPGYLANLGHCFIAIDPTCFAPGFEGRLSDLMGYLRNMEPVDPSKPVLVAGDPEKMHMAAVDKAGGVRYVKNQLDSCQRLGDKLSVKCLVPLS